MFKTETRKRAGRKFTALAAAIAMTATIAVPAVNAAPVSAAEKDMTVKTEQSTAGIYTEIKDPPLDTTEKVDAEISTFGNTILNSNGELWHRLEMGTAKYQKKSGIAKAYDRVYLDTKGTASFLKNDNATAARENVKDIGRFSLLQADGTLVDAYTNRVIDTQVKAWYEADARDGQMSLLLKENGDVYTFANGRLGSKVSSVSNVRDISRSALLDKDGNLYNLSFDYNEDTYEEESCRASQGNQNVQKLVILRDNFSSYVNCLYIKDGCSYAGYDNQRILEKEAAACKKACR